MSNQEGTSSMSEELSNRDGAKGMLDKLSKQEGTNSTPEELSNQDGTKTMLDKLSNQKGTSSMPEELSNQDGTKAILDKLSNQEGTSSMPEELSNRDGTKAMLDQLSIINLNLEKLINIKKEVRPQALVQAKPPLYSLPGEDINTDNSIIYRAAIRDDWDSAVAVFENDKEKLKVKLSPSGDTALHIAVGTNSSHTFVKKIVEMLIDKFTKQELRMKNRYGDTALHMAARVGNLKAAELLVFHDPQMLEVINEMNHMPIWLAAWGNDLETLHYLLSVTLKKDLELNRNGFCSEPKDDSKFLYVCIKSGHYDVALYLIKKYPQLVWENCGAGTPLMTLASKPEAFCSGLCLRYTEYYWFYKFIYNCIPISVDDESLSFKMPDTTAVTKDGANNEHSSEIAVPPAAVPVWKVYFNNLTRWTVVPLREAYSSIILLLMLSNLLPRGSFLSLLEGASRYLLRILSFLPSVCYLILVYPIVYLAKKVKCIIKEVHDEKLKHRRAELIVAAICSTLLKKPPADNIDVYEDVLRRAVYIAIKNGCIELLEKCIEEYPGTIWCTQPEYSFFALAIKHRQEKVFNLLYQMSAYKVHMLNHRDNLQNALHAAGELPPYNRLNTVTGPALQLQRELLWFQKVEEFSETSSLHFRNKDFMTPKTLFTEQHKDLLRDAQEWTKGTTASSTVVGALIVTITFAAIFTAPGGYEEDDNKGTPVFLGRKLFQIFVFTDTAALFFSATSVLSFLSTLTCLSQEDFLSAVPWRLTIGFISLYISLVATVVAFGATLVLVLESEFHWIKTMVITVGCLPIMLNSWWQFPLFLELLRGTVWLTFGKSIFHKQKDLLIH